MGKKGYYKLLNISDKATANEIKLAYRKKAKEIHPDKNKDNDTTKEFQQLNEAYEILSDEVKRKEYDYDFINFTFSTGKFDNSEYQIYSTNIKTFNCNCEDWTKNRSNYKSYDPRRLCKHLVSKLLSTDLPEEFKPFKDYLQYRQSTFRGVKLFNEIVFLESSIVVVDYYGAHLYLYLKKQKDEFCSYKVFEVHKYKGIGYKWMGSYYNEEILYKDKIDGKDYINKRFNVINKDVPLCNFFYRQHLHYEKYRIVEEYKSEFEITSTILKQIKSNYTTQAFNKKLQEMGYIVKSKELNKNDWILQANGLEYGINYTIDSILPSIEIPSWYISTFFDSKTMSFKHEKQINSINKTNIIWNKQKFNKLLEVMNEHVMQSPIEKKREPIINKRQLEREKWLINVSCHICGSKNIHKKNKRVYGYGTVQRYQCIDCKKIFQEEIVEEMENITDISNITKQDNTANSAQEEEKFNIDKEDIRSINEIKTELKNNIFTKIFNFLCK